MKLIIVILLCVLVSSAQALTDKEKFILGATLVVAGVYFATDGVRTVTDTPAVYHSETIMHININRRGGYSTTYSEENVMVQPETWKQKDVSLAILGVAAIGVGCGLVGSVDSGRVSLKKSIKF